MHNGDPLHNLTDPHTTMRLGRVLQGCVHHQNGKSATQPIPQNLTDLHITLQHTNERQVCVQVGGVLQDCVQVSSVLQGCVLVIGVLRGCVQVGGVL